jgi:hypothetical protein
MFLKMKNKLKNTLKYLDGHLALSDGVELWGAYPIAINIQTLRVCRAGPQCSGGWRIEQTPKRFLTFGRLNQAPGH